MLLFHDGNFLQVLEGEQAVVEALFEKISADERHRRVAMFYRGHCAEREFGDWSMAFHAPTAEKLAEIGGAEGFRQMGSLSPGEVQSAKIRAFMKGFYQSTRAGVS